MAAIEDDISELDVLLKSLWRGSRKSLISAELSRKVGKLANEIAETGRTQSKNFTTRSHWHTVHTAIQPPHPTGTPKGCHRQASRDFVQRASLETSAVDVSECESQRRLPSSISYVNLKTESVNDQLQARLDGLRLTKVEVSRHSNIVNTLQDMILKHLISVYPDSFKWKICNSGSYYEKTKISKPDEFDCLLICSIRAKFVYGLPDCPSKSYCAMQILSRDWEPKKLLTTHGKFVCPKNFINQFRQHIATVTRTHYGASIETESPTGKSPAVTLRYTDEEGRFSIDLVPGVRLVEWPEPAKLWYSKWLPEKHWKEIKESVSQCVVCKIHPSEYEKEPATCKFWRLSFSAAEKKILLHADGIHHKKSVGKESYDTCRKDVLRLLKDDREMFYQNNRILGSAIGSFYLKTTVLLLFEIKHDNIEWMRSNLSERYKDALDMVARGLDSGNINHYFIEGENLIELTEYTQSHLQKFAKYIRSKHNDIDKL